MHWNFFAAQQRLHIRKCQTQPSHIHAVWVKLCLLNHLFKHTVDIRLKLCNKLIGYLPIEIRPCNPKLCLCDVRFNFSCLRTSSGTHTHTRITLTDLKVNNLPVGKFSNLEAKSHVSVLIVFNYFVLNVVGLYLYWQFKPESAPLFYAAFCSHF